MTDTTYSLAQALAASGISDKDLVYIADAVFAAENPNGAVALNMFARHQKKHGVSGGISSTFETAAKVRGIDLNTGTKVTTVMVDLLA